MLCELERYTKKLPCVREGSHDQLRSDPPMNSISLWRNNCQGHNVHLYSQQLDLLGNGNAKRAIMWQETQYVRQVMDCIHEIRLVFCCVCHSFCAIQLIRLIYSNDALALFITWALLCVNSILKSLSGGISCAAS